MSKSNKTSKLSTATKVCFAIGATAAIAAGGIYLYKLGFLNGKTAGESADTLLDLAAKLSK